MQLIFSEFAVFSGCREVFQNFSAETRQICVKTVYSFTMDSIQKFHSDLEKIKKYNRTSGGRYDGEKACREAAELLVRENPSVRELAMAVSDYWLNAYILSSADIQNEPSDIHMEKLEAMQALLQGDDQTDALEAEDWKELCSIVNAEAEELPMDLLNDLMSVFLDHQAF